MRRAFFLKISLYAMRIIDCGEDKMSEATCDMVRIEREGCFIRQISLEGSPFDPTNKINNSVAFP